MKMKTTELTSGQDLDFFKINIFDLIEKWNEKQVDLFKLTLPDENLEFFGVVRFSFQHIDSNYFTKCLKISNAWTTIEVINILIEKFRLNEQLEQTFTFTLWEVHKDGYERPLYKNEYPLLVQLKWTQSENECRFLLKKCLRSAVKPPKISLEKRLSKNKKGLKKNRQTDFVADKEAILPIIYDEYSNSSLSKTLSNPELITKNFTDEKDAYHFLPVHCQQRSINSLKNCQIKLQENFSLQSLQRPHQNLVSSLNTEQYSMDSSPYSSSIYGSSVFTEFPLPILVECPQQISDEELFYELFNPSAPLNRFRGFRLTPAFVIYMVCRHRLSLLLPNSNRAHAGDCVQFISKGVDTLNDIISSILSGPPDVEFLLFVLANTSEFLSMLQFDIQLYKNFVVHLRLHERIGILINRVFDVLVDHSFSLINSSVDQFLHFIVPMVDHNNADFSPTKSLLDVFSDFISLARRYLLNPQLANQFYSHIFFYLNAIVFNKIVLTIDWKNGLNRSLGFFLEHQFELIQQWFEQQDLSFPINGVSSIYMFNKIKQLAILLKTSKSFDQLSNLASVCCVINSVQMKYILENYVPETREIPLSSELVDRLINLSRVYADQTLMKAGYQIQLDENLNIDVPFSYPKDGYVFESLRGVPSDMILYLDSLHRRGVIRVLQPSSNKRNPHQLWTGHMCFNRTLQPKFLTNSPSLTQNISENNDFSSLIQNKDCGIDYTPEYTTIGVTLQRSPTKGIGLSIVEIAEKGVDSAIYIKKVIEESPAFMDGRLEIGDQLLSVNGVSLIGVNQDDAANALKSAGLIVHIEVAKKTLNHKGLDMLLHSDEVSSGLTFTTCDLQNRNSALSINHQQPTGLSSALPSNLLAARLPSHYRFATYRPMVVAPGRLTPELYSSNNITSCSKEMSSVSSSNLSTQCFKPIQSGLFVTKLGSIQTAANKDENGPHVKNWPSSIPDQNSLNIKSKNCNRLSNFGGDTNFSPPNTSTNSTVTNDEDNSQCKATNSFKHNDDFGADSSLRFHAPAIGNTFNNGTKVPQAMTIEQMHFELKKLKSLERPMTEKEKQHYHQLFNYISITNDFASRNSSKSRLSGQIIPYINEMELRLKSGNSVLTSRHRRSSSISIDDMASLVNSAEKQFDEVDAAKEVHEASVNSRFSFDSSFNVSACSKKQPPPVPLKPKKEAVFGSIDSGRKDKAEEMENLVSCFHQEELSIPHSEIVGTQEIYTNDPRLRRLEEATSHRMLKPVDGSDLGFRDKLKLFGNSLSSNIRNQSGSENR